MPKNSPNDERPSFQTRLACAGIVLGLSLIIFFALQLHPDPRGFGTHQQLGLPECTFKRIFGRRCPHCGMTTSMTCLVRGQWSLAWSANPGGYVLSILMLCGLPMFAFVAVTGRYWLTSQPFHWLFLAGLMYVSFVVVVWVIRIVLLRL